MITIFIFIILLLLSAFFSSAETAFFSLSQSQLRVMQKKQQRFASLVARLKRKPQRLLTTILLGNNIVNLFTASFATVVASDFFGSAAIGVATGATTFFVLLFGEIIPKSFAYAQSTLIARWAAPALWGVEIILYPLVRVFDFLGALARKVFRITDNKRITEEEVRMAARLGVEHGEINYREHEMIENIFRFDDTPVDDIMTPLYKVVLLNGTVPVEQIAHFVSHEEFSRYPVYDGRDEGNILGYVHVNDLMKALNSDRRDEPLKNFVSDVTIIDETTKVERVFRAMKADRTHLYIVHKENDPTTLVGIVTLEDLIEEIVGEIEDESDQRD